MPERHKRLEDDRQASLLKPADAVAAFEYIEPYVSL